MSAAPGQVRYDLVEDIVHSDWRTEDCGLSFSERIRRTDDQIAILQENTAMINVVEINIQNTMKLCTPNKTASRKPNSEISKETIKKTIEKSTIQSQEKQ